MRFILSAIALTAAAAPLAAASVSEQTVTVRVDVSDIDLASDQGRAALEARAEAKLRAACTIESNSRYGFGRDIVDQKCVSDARTAVLDQAARVAANAARGGGEVSAN